MPLIQDDFFSFTGGSTIIDLEGDDGGAPRNRIFRAKRRHPGTIAIALSADVITAENRAAPPIADIEWQVGGGLHSATVDIGQGCTFTIGAAEVVDVTARFDTDGVIGAGAPETQSSSYRVFGTAAPGTNQRSAYRSQRVQVPAGGNVSNEVAVPGFAHKLWCYVTDSTAAGLLTNLVAQFQASAGGQAVALEAWLQGEQPFRVPGNAQNVVFSSSAAAAPFTLTLIWEIDL